MRYLILVIFFAFDFIGAQTNYYVSTTGNNTNDGLTINTPFQTINYAVAQANHGDTILVMAGTYTNSTYGNNDYWKTDQTVKINNKNSSSGLYLTIKPYNNALVKLKGDGDFIFQIRNSSYIIVEGFDIEGEVSNIPLSMALQYQFLYKDINGTIQERVPFGTPESQIETMSFPVLSYAQRPSYFNTIGLLVQNSHHVIIRKNNIHHLPGTGLRGFQSDYFTFSENEIHHNSSRSSSGNHGLVIHSSTSIDNNDAYKIFISKNKVYQNYNEVYSWSEIKTFITPHIDEGKGISMQKNTVGNGWQHGKIKIDNNIAYENGFSGVHINEGIRIDIINNTCYNNSLSGNGTNIGISVADANYVNIYNNISVAPTWGDALSSANSTNLVVSKNLVVGNLNNSIAPIANATIYANPLFVNQSAYDFHLTSGSPAINAALASFSPTDDYYSVLRDSNPDIGAVEYTSTLSASENSNSNTEIKIYPNPAMNFLSIETKNILQKNILLYTQDGRNVSSLLKPLNKSNNLLTFGLEALNTGFYFMKIDSKTFRIIKK